MTRQLRIELSEELAANAEHEAKRRARPVDAVIEDAVIEYFGWLAIEETQAANTDMEEASAERLAYGELHQLRAERDEE